MKRSDLIERLAWINALSNSWRRLRDSIDDQNIRAYMLPGWQNRFEKWVSQNGEGFVFSRFTLLWLMRQGFAVSSPTGEPINTGAKLEELGVACLIANDLSCYEVPRRLNTDLEFAANMMPSVEYFSMEEFDHDIARTHYLLTKIAPEHPESSVRQLPTVIEKLIGCPLHEYFDFVLASAIKPVTVSGPHVGTFVLQSYRPDNFANTAISPDRASELLRSVSWEEEQFVTGCAETKVPTADLTLFRERPFLKRTSDYLPLDAGFILDKAGKGLLWTALKRSEDKQERESLLPAWGDLTEAYVNELLQLCVTPGRSVISRPCFPDGGEAFDACVIEGRTMIAIETKASALPSAAKYSDDPAALGSVLEKKFITGDGTSRKGLAQLSRSILAFDSGRMLVDASTGMTIRAESISKVIPVLVHLDTALRAPRISQYMADRFRAMGRPRRFVMTPLLLASVSDLESILGYLDETALTDVIESFLPTLRKDRVAVFEIASIPAVRKLKIRKGPVSERFSSFMDAALRRLFPREIE